MGMSTREGRDRFCSRTPLVRQLIHFYRVFFSSFFSIAFSEFPNESTIVIQGIFLFSFFSKLYSVLFPVEKHSSFLFHRFSYILLIFPILTRRCCNSTNFGFAHFVGPSSPFLFFVFSFVVFSGLFRFSIYRLGPLRTASWTAYTHQLAHTHTHTHTHKLGTCLVAGSSSRVDSRRFQEEEGNGGSRRGAGLFHHLLPITTIFGIDYFSFVLPSRRGMISWRRPVNPSKPQ